MTIFSQYLVINLFCHNNRFVNPPLFHRTENLMYSHPDYHAHSLLLAPWFRDIQGLRVMDYKGLQGEDCKLSQHTECMDVSVCGLTVLWHRLTLMFPKTRVLIEILIISIKRKQATSTIPCLRHGWCRKKQMRKVFPQPANSWEQREHTAAFWLPAQLPAA